MKVFFLPKIIVKFRCALYLYVHYTHRDRSKPRERMSLCAVIYATRQIERIKSAVLKPKQNKQYLKNVMKF